MSVRIGHAVFIQLLLVVVVGCHPLSMTVSELTNEPRNVTPLGCAIPLVRVEARFCQIERGHSLRMLQPKLVRSFTLAL